MPTKTAPSQPAPRPLGCLPASVDVPQVKAAIRLLTHDGQPLAAFDERDRCTSAGAYLDPRRETGEVVLELHAVHRSSTPWEEWCAERLRVTVEYADLFRTAGWIVQEFQERDHTGQERLARLILTPPQPTARERMTAALAERFPAGSAAVYVPEGATERDVVVVNSGPDKDGTVEVLSMKQGGKALRVPLAALEELPELPPEPEGEITDWWTVTDAQGVELTRVEAEDDPRARKAAMRHAAVVAAARRDKGFAIRRLRTSELSVPVGELRGLPRTA
ncbi:hypothetical protein [Streptomyces sp. CL12-4]|uniref:hypothetical protein n=1 Tax=Streptomyces sp. CL12-4 TaxID=2810306 RepID=UPI001EFBCF42|nr:hypothetical protein [Streptomyces sp. CL12-4]MCG8971838.1 hypothetical protein [Streptomyces sp. CL12-4]